MEKAITYLSDFFYLIGKKPLIKLIKLVRI